jgi:hypothetical protein
MRALPLPIAALAALAALAVLAALATGCATRTITLHEVSPPGRARARVATPRSEESVEVYRNAPPKRPFVTRYVIDLSPLVPPAMEALAKHLEHAARVGCDGIIVYTEEHPVIKAGPRSDDEVLTLGLDGVLTSRPMGLTVPNRRAIFIETSKGHMIVVDGAPEEVSLCLAYEDPHAAP